MTGPRATATFHVKRSLVAGNPGEPVIDRMAEVTPAPASFGMRPPLILERGVGKAEKTYKSWTFQTDSM